MMISSCAVRLLFKRAEADTVGVCVGRNGRLRLRPGLIQGNGFLLRRAHIAECEHFIIGSCERYRCEWNNPSMNYVVSEIRDTRTSLMRSWLADLHASVSECQQAMRPLSVSRCLDGKTFLRGGCTTRCMPSDA